MLFGHLLGHSATKYSINYLEGIYIPPQQYIELIWSIFIYLRLAAFADTG